MCLQSKLGSLMDEQRESKRSQLEDLQYPSEADRTELVRTIDTQCQIEQDELSYMLSLEQAEHAEKLRKVQTAST